MATFFPRFAAPPLDVELVFLVDCSATMRGSPLARAQAILHLCLAQLPPGTYFNVVSFGSKASCLFADSVEATAERVASARQFVDALARIVRASSFKSPLISLNISLNLPVFPAPLMLRCAAQKRRASAARAPLISLNLP